jgi:hypothetical protein
MSSNGKPSAIAAAATAVEEDLDRYEQLSTELKNLTISSQKNLVRATKLLEESAGCEQKLAADVGALVEAMQAARTKQQSCGEATLAAAEHIQARMTQHAALMEKFATLGERARSASEPVAAVMAQHAASVDPAELAKGLGEVTERMEVIVNETEAMIREAEAGDWSDLVREAESLKQKVQAARNKVLLTQRKVAERAPS